ncbi:MAG TPA: hypothetical protein VGG34_07160 [Opitutaceae bacterium]
MTHKALRQFASKESAVYAVAQQEIGFSGWDQKADIPRDCGDIANWALRGDYPNPELPAPPPEKA